MTTRRQFLRGNFSPRPAPLRPPWALAETAFLAACTRCGDCIRACPKAILVTEGGYPRVDFGRGECTFCGDCLTACASGALCRTDEQPPWRLELVIANACLAQRDVVCRTCGEACAPGAIRFRPRLGGAALPEADAALCTGCGACVAPCPVQAISLRLAP
jgi:ferredoxin-type protein NapF